MFLLVTAIIFTIALAATFVLWFRPEGPLSIHSTFTNRREVHYWLTILFTFALGTAAGDLVAEQFGLSYLLTGDRLILPGARCDPRLLAGLYLHPPPRRLIRHPSHRGLHHHHPPR